MISVGRRPRSSVRYSEQRKAAGSRFMDRQFADRALNWVELSSNSVVVGVGRAFPASA